MRLNVLDLRETIRMLDVNRRNCALRVFRDTRSFDLEA